MNHPVITSTQIKLLEHPLNQPFRIAVGQHDSLHNVLLILTIKGSIKSYGEAAVATHITGETIKQTVKNLNLVGKFLVGKDLGDFARLSWQAREMVGQNKCALAAVEMALLDGLTKFLGMPLWRFFGQKPAMLSTDITIVVGSLDEARDKTDEFYKKGFRRFKIKVGKDFDLDLQRVMAVSRHAPKSCLILDANQGFSAKQTLAFLKELSRKRIKISLIEQPVPKADWEGLKRVTALSSVDVCADESVSSLLEATRAIREKAVDVINIKFMKTGILEARDIAFLAKVNGLGLMIGGMMESNLAMTASAHMAAGLNCFDYVDLDTPFFIKDHVRNNPFLNTKGEYRFKNIPAGIGVSP